MSIHPFIQSIHANSENFNINFNFIWPRISRKPNCSAQSLKPGHTGLCCIFWPSKGCYCFVDTLVATQSSDLSKNTVSKHHKKLKFWKSHSRILKSNLHLRAGLPIYSSIFMYLRITFKLLIFCIKHMQKNEKNRFQLALVVPSTHTPVKIYNRQHVNIFW